MDTSLRLPKKPVAGSEKVEDLVDMVNRGQIRIPWFQRGWKWEASDVRELFDSVYRGYPIGSLLFYRRHAPADRLRIGPLVIDASEEASAWWVVDGQQRLTALTACLKRGVPLPARLQGDDPFVLYFAVDEQTIHLPPRAGAPPTTWVPLPTLLDASELTEWAFLWQHGRDEGLRRVLFDAGARIREYAVPLYLVEAEEEVAQQIFVRTNRTGKSLEWQTVHKALFGQQASHPSTLTDLQDELSGVGMGQLSENRLLTALMSLRGLDPTRIDENFRRNPEVLRDAVQEVLPVLRRTLSFLRRDTEIPHIRLLPKPILLDVLTRFFALHAEPSPRTRTLLSRWFWRIVLGTGAFDDRTLRRRGIKSIEQDDEEASIQRLLSLVNPRRNRPFELPAAFDGRSDDNRIVLATLAHLKPRHLDTGQPLDVATLLEEEDQKAFARIVKRSGVEGTRSPANRILQPKGTPVLKLLQVQEPSLFEGESVPASHAISEEALASLARGDLPGFLAKRIDTLTESVRTFAARMAAWEHSDRPSIDYLLREAEAAAS